MALAPMLWCFSALFIGALGSAHGWPWHVVALVSGLLGVLCRIGGVSWGKASAIVVLVVVGYVWCEVCLGGCGQSYLRALPREEAHVRFRLALVQTPLGGGRLGRWDSGRGQIIGEMRAMETVMDDGMNAVSGRVSIQTEDISLKERLRGLAVGDVLEGSGVMLRVPESADPVNGFYGEYLKANGVFRELQLEAMDVVGRERTPQMAFRRLMRSCRETLGLLLLRGVKDDEAAQLLLALGLGLGEFITSDSRTRQVASGTVHVFAISGMHVGMAALIISLLLRWAGLPLRWQWAVTGVLDGAYVLLTGASPSGMRALLMALLVLYAHFRWRTPSWLNTLGLAGTAGILFNPAIVLNLGFVYSYGVVAMLLMLSPLTKRMNEVLAERNAWVPRELRRHRRTKALSWLANGVIVSCVAWLGSAGISMRVNHRISLLAPLINLPLGVMVYMTLMLCPVKILLSAILPKLDGVWAGVICSAMKTTEFLATCGAESTLCVPVAQFAYWESVLFYCALVWMLLCARGDLAGVGEGAGAEGLTAESSARRSPR